MDDISVIIPVFNASGSIHAALESVAGQTLKPRQVIVVDDGSSDNSFDAAKAMTGHMNGIELIVHKQTNLGAGAARNRAIQSATGSWLAFLDGDDVWCADKLKRTMAVLKDGGYDLAAHDYTVLKNGVQVTIECAKLFRQYPDPVAGLYRKGFIATSTVVVRREWVEKAGGFDEDLKTAQDFDLWLKILTQAPTRFTVFDEPLMRYGVTAGSITSFTARRLDCSMIILNRHGPAMMKRRGGIGNIFYRIIAVHYEAIAASFPSRRFGFMLRCFLLLPFRLLKATHFLFIKDRTID